MRKLARDTWTRAARPSRGTVITICYGCAGSRTEPDGRTRAAAAAAPAVIPTRTSHVSAGGVVAASPPACHP